MQVQNFVLWTIFQIKMDIYGLFPMNMYYVQITFSSFPKQSYPITSCVGYKHNINIALKTVWFWRIGSSAFYFCEFRDDFLRSYNYLLTLKYITYTSINHNIKSYYVIGILYCRDSASWRIKCNITVLTILWLLWKELV